MIQSQSYCETPFLWRPRAARLTETWTAETRTAGQPSAGTGEALSGDSVGNWRTPGGWQCRACAWAPHFRRVRMVQFIWICYHSVFKKDVKEEEEESEEEDTGFGKKTSSIFDWDDWRSFSFFPQQREILILQSGPPPQFSSQRTLVRWKSVVKWACGSVRWHGTSFFWLPSLIQGQALHQTAQAGRGVTNTVILSYSSLRLKLKLSSSFPLSSLKNTRFPTGLHREGKSGWFHRYRQSPRPGLRRLLGG